MKMGMFFRVVVGVYEFVASRGSFAFVGHEDVGVSASHGSDAPDHARYAP